MKRFLFIILFGYFSLLLFGNEISIKLIWDNFEGECNGFLYANVNNKFDFVQGVKTETKMNNQLQSLGEKSDFEAIQTFKINSKTGKFSFWITNKFLDDALNNDPDLIVKCQPKIEIYQDNVILDRISIVEGKGLTCKVFEFYPQTNQIIKYRKFYPKKKIIIGKVVNALNNEPLDNVKIEISDITKEKEILKTNENGEFLYNYEIAEYFLNFSKKGYISNKTSVRCNADEMPREIFIALSPKTEKTRIVLTWGYMPYDLDAHLSGPKPSGNRFHIWYRNQIEIGGKNFLDRDDVAHYGPETITIYKPASGEYFYAVHNYSDLNNLDSFSLSQSNARIDIYNDETLVKTIKVSENQKGNCWFVFKINSNNDLEVINKITDINNEKKIPQNFNNLLTD